MYAPKNKNRNNLIDIHKHEPHTFIASKRLSRGYIKNLKVRSILDCIHAAPSENKKKFHFFSFQKYIVPSSYLNLHLRN